MADAEAMMDGCQRSFSISVVSHLGIACDASGTFSHVISTWSEQRRGAVEVYP